MKHYELGVKFYKQKGKKHNQALLAIRDKRDKAIKEVDEWEELRELASGIKEFVIKNLDNLLDEFIKNAKELGVEVYFAKDAKEHNEIVLNELRNINAKKVVKSKSMLTEECGLNEFLQENGIEVIDTDLGERIVQLRKEKPSHIVLPAIHTTKEEVAKILGEKNTDPTYLTHKMRELLREEFLSADAGISGANFLVANRGFAVVCTNEGNADLGAILPKLHIISVGIEKVVPRLEDLGILLRMLARNATGQKITTYTTLFGKKDNGKRIIILVDNGRKEKIKSEFKEILKCIRCSACITTCPVYRRSGGHSYRYVIPGPIGSILAFLEDSEEYSDLPFACTLCKSCEAICAVKIPFERFILKARGEVENNPMLKVGEFILSNEVSFKIFSKILRLMPKELLEKIVSEWSKYKAMPIIPQKRFIK